MVIERQNKVGFIDSSQAGEALAEFFSQNDYTGKRILLLVPDNTRSGPVGDIFRMDFDCIGQKAKAFDVLVALGTHPPMTEEQICSRLSITADERKKKYA
ncbi:MAG: hypothetical protein ACYS9Y_14295, partial [Planctomycetota bacterium]